MNMYGLSEGHHPPHKHPPVWKDLTLRRSDAQVQILSSALWMKLKRSERLVVTQEDKGVRDSSFTLCKDRSHRASLSTTTPVGTGTGSVV